MNSFLRNTAAKLLDSGRKMEDLVVVLPNRRAGLFFTQHLGSLIKEPTWMPEVKTIEQVFYEYGNQIPTDDLTLIFELYRVYESLQSEAEDFDRFYFWGELILKDFNDMDQFMADAKIVYRNLADIKELESDLSYLNSEQVELISKFWKSFSQQKIEEREKFLRFWQILEQLYTQFQANLDVSGLAYSGKIYRSVIERLDALVHPDKHYIFLGFNAFTLTEERLIKHFVSEFDAEIYWDIDDYYLKDPRQEAGLFFRDYQKDTILGPTFPEEIPDLIREKANKINSYSIPLKINQANLVGKILEQIGEDENLEETVVILPDEQLLFPALHAVPEAIGTLNVTMGYPIRNTPIFSFLDAILDLQRYVKIKDEGITFYHKPVTDLLSFPYWKSSTPDFVPELLAEIKKTNIVDVAQNRLARGGEMFSLIFQKIESDGLFEYLGEIMQQLANDLDEDPIQRSYLYQAYKQLTRIKEIFKSNSPGKVTVDFHLKLFRQIFREIKLPFEGEPLAGLQFMGVLESRNLDFRRVIICDVNEGSFPPGGGINSMIPFNLRRAFGLPVQEQNDAIYAYTFYRLLHQAEEVHLIYTTASEQGKAGEMSRFMQQMQVELGISAPEPVLVPVDLTRSKEISIEKTSEVMRQLSNYFKKEDGAEFQKQFSASALNSYLDCRLRFYFKYIAGLKEKEEVVTEIDPMTFGTMLHKAIELLYKVNPTIGYLDITAHSIERLKIGIPKAVDEAIAHFYELDQLDETNISGQLMIARSIFRKYLEAILDYDQDNGDFRVLTLEGKYESVLTVQTSTGEKEVRLGGFIDRVDLKDGAIRLIDYKTGKDDKKVASISSLFDREDKKRNKAAMQTILYAFFYQYVNPKNRIPLKPAIFNIKEIYKKDFSPFLLMENQEIANYQEIREEFENGLRGLLEEIYDNKQPFNQTDDLKKCTYCAYKDICGR